MSEMTDITTDRVYAWKWKLKYWFHYWFGKCPWDIQVGDFMSGRILPSEKEVTTVFRDQIAMMLYLLHAEVIGKVSLICIKPLPSSSDPLGQIGSWAWKCNVRVHTRHSWEKYQKTLIRATIHFAKPKVN